MMQTQSDIAFLDESLKTIKNRYGAIKYKDILLINYVRALKGGDRRMFRHLKSKLSKAYKQLGFDDNSIVKDMFVCTESLKNMHLKAVTGEEWRLCDGI